MFDTLADWEVATDKLGADAAYNSAVEKSDGLFTGPVIDQMASLLSPLPESQPLPRERFRFAASRRRLLRHQ